MLSPSSAGLFHAGIAQSGSSLCPWAFSPKPKEMARRLAKATGCPEDSKELKECLKGKTAEEILVAQDAVNVSYTAQEAVDLKFNKIVLKFIACW